MRVEIVECFLKIECTCTIFAKHHDKGRIPHKEISVKRGVNKIGDKMELSVSRTQIDKRRAPSIVIASEHVIAAAPNRSGEQMRNILIFGQFFILCGHRKEYVVFYKRRCLIGHVLIHLKAWHNCTSFTKVLLTYGSYHTKSVL